jgi:hypothetical protein
MAHWSTAAWLLLGHHIALVAPDHSCDVAGLRAAARRSVAASCVARAPLTPGPARG